MSIPDVELHCCYSLSVELPVTPTSNFMSLPRSGHLTDSQAMQYVKQRVADDARSIQVCTC